MFLARKLHAVIMLCGLHLPFACTQNCWDTMSILGTKLGSVHFHFLISFQHKRLCFQTFTFHHQPPMSDARKRVIGEAFNKLDKSGDGFITIDDVRGVYDVKVDIMRDITCLNYWMIYVPVPIEFENYFVLVQSFIIFNLIILLQRIGKQKDNVISK